MAAAPVCHIPSSSEVADPTARQFPSIPQATDLQSALAAINAMRQILQQLMGMLTPNNLQVNNNYYGMQQPGGGGRITTNTRKPSQKRDRGFIEVHRVTSRVRVYNPNDHEQYVDVERINQLVLRDNITGALWVWNR